MEFAGENLSRACAPTGVLWNKGDTEYWEVDDGDIDVIKPPIPIALA